MSLLIRVALGVLGVIVAVNTISPGVGQRIQQDMRSVALVAGIVSGIIIGARK